MGDKSYGIDFGGSKVRLAAFGENGPSFVPMRGQRSLSSHEAMVSGYPEGFPWEKGPKAVELALGPNVFENAPWKVMPDLAKAVFSELIREARASQGHEVKKAVIAVPVSFGDTPRRQLIKGANAAGLEVLRLINQTTATALYFAHQYPDFSKFGNLNPARELTLLVCDLGAVYSEISVVKAGPLIEVLSTLGDTQFCGREFDKAIARHVIGEFFKRLNGTPHFRRRVRELSQSPPASFLGPNKSVMRPTVSGLGFKEEALGPIILAAARLKTTLNDAKASQALDFVDLPFMGRAFDLALEVTYGEVKSALDDFLTMLMAAVERVMALVKIVPDRIDQVVLVGGQARMPLVWEKFSKRFGPAKMTALATEAPQSPSQALGLALSQATGKSPALDPELAPALGAALEAGILEGQIAGPTLVELCHRGVSLPRKGLPPPSEALKKYLSFQNARLEYVIPPRSALPVRIATTFNFARQVKDKIEVQLFDGLDPGSPDTDFLGTFSIMVGNTYLDSSITLEFSIDVNGLFHLRPYKCAGQSKFAISFHQAGRLEMAFDGDSNVKFTKDPKDDVYRQVSEPSPAGAKAPGQGAKGQGPKAQGAKAQGAQGQALGVFGRAGFGERLKGSPDQTEISDLDATYEDAYSPDGGLAVNYHVRRARVFLKKQTDPTLAQKVRAALEAYQTALSRPDPIDAIVGELETKLLTLID
ncbi:MAG: Hsp70 family protein [Deltaproteobacteria bacterium]|jgi:molecular chaperone DnaK (HSP70)|nr:Hsp70 family protein [Deltaproteobacteria bacterium]